MCFCVSFKKLEWSGRDDCVSFIYVSFIVSFIDSFIGTYIRGGVEVVGVIRFGDIRGEVCGFGIIGDSVSL